jgi:hypothetical protein
MAAMPRGSPKRRMMLRIDPATVAAVAAHDVPFTQAVEEGLALWLARQKRRQRGKGDPLARYLAPPTAREIAARKPAA